MFELPKGTILGALELEMTLEYFDFPRIFTCRNSTNQVYLVLSTFDDELSSQWLYLPISPKRLGAALCGAITLRDAFRGPEGGYLYTVETFFDRSPDVTHVLPEQLSDDDLPSAGYSLDAAVANVDSDDVLTPRTVAKIYRRETFDYRIFPDERTKHEVSARKLGTILSTTQELIDALGQTRLGTPTVRGALPPDLLERTSVSVSHSFRGSFGVQFRAFQPSDLFGYSLVSDVLSEFSYLLQAGDSEDLLSNKLHALKGRVASKYRRLLKQLFDLNSGLSFDWGAVAPDRGGEFSLSREQVRRAYMIVDRIDIAMADEIEVRGQLVGFNSRTMRYELRVVEGSTHYAGKVAADAKISVEHPAIGDFYLARLRMLVETQSSSGDELVRWVLVGLNDV